jgi:hypothetical protein
MMNEAEAWDARQHVLKLEYIAIRVMHKATKVAQQERARAAALKLLIEREAPEGHKKITDEDQLVFLREKEKRNKEAARRNRSSLI